MGVMNVHPFPARMAPDVALGKTKDLTTGSVILDPMMGSGTVIQVAHQAGHHAIGMDVDPLAVLMTKVAISSIDERRFDRLVSAVLYQAKNLRLDEVNLSWFDDETEKFSNYWFAPRQRNVLKRLAHVFRHNRQFNNAAAEGNALRIALSRLIVTKERGASLARDVSHSRPHKVIHDNNNDFDVYEHFEKLAGRLKSALASNGRGSRPSLRLGDARRLPWVRDQSIDMIVTSPPYLNAIDYMRGHRLSLIWLGHNLASLRQIRSESIGAERGPDSESLHEGIKKIRAAFGKIQKLPNRHQKMVERYALDLFLMMKQARRVLKPAGEAVFVVGNSCLKETFISNARGIEEAARLAGLKLIEENERELPNQNRYLPTPSSRETALGRRMRTESVLTFRLQTKQTA